MHKISHIVASILACLSTVSAPSMAADDGSAKVDLSFSGQILASTCQINSDTATKTINFGALPASIGQGESASQSINLSFIGCPEETKQLSVTLIGESSTAVKDGLKITPTTNKGDESSNTLAEKDIGIIFTDSKGNIIPLGKPSDLITFNQNDGTAEIFLQTKVKGNSSRDAGTGAFTAAATLNVAYL